MTLLSQTHIPEASIQILRTEAEIRVAIAHEVPGNEAHRRVLHRPIIPVRHAQREVAELLRLTARDDLHPDALLLGLEFDVDLCIPDDGEAPVALASCDSVISSPAMPSERRTVAR